jgi:hypothetical protein
MSQLTDKQLDVLGTAWVMARAGTGFAIDAERVVDRATADSLVKSGHMVSIPGVDGGYRISDGYWAAVEMAAARRAEAAKDN